MSTAQKTGHASLICGALLCMITLSACGRLNNVGRAPDMSPVGSTKTESAPVAPSRVALATPTPAEQAAMHTSPAPIRPPASTASLWRSGPASLFGDRRAQGRGDILTVVIEIDEEASISNASQRRRTANEDLSVGAFLGLPGLINDITGVNLDPAAQVTAGSSSAGDGSVQRTEQITLRLAATVTNVLPNGHFVITGSQEVRVNFELRDLQVRGVIRPEDISRGNEITYDKIADARISYGGRGQITDVQQPRVGQQIADIVLPF